MHHKAFFARCEAALVLVFGEALADQMLACEHFREAVEVLAAWHEERPEGWARALALVVVGACAGALSWTFAPPIREAVLAQFETLARQR